MVELDLAMEGIEIGGRDPKETLGEASGVEIGQVAALQRTAESSTETLKEIQSEEGEGTTEMTGEVLHLEGSPQKIQDTTVLRETEEGI